MSLNRPLPAARAGGWPVAGRLGPVVRHPSAQTAAVFLLIWFASRFIAPRLGWPAGEVYVVQPLLWLALLAWVLWRWRRETPAAAFPRPRGLMVTGLLLGALQVAVLVLLGLVFGFGHTLLARQWPLVLLNLWFAGAQLAGFEFARWYFVRGLARWSPGLAVGLAWPLFALCALPPAAFGQLGSLGSGMVFLGRDLLPAFSENLLATCLTLLGGPLPALLYRGLPELVEWVAPILPRLSWLAAAFAGTILPIVGLILIYDNDLPGGPAVTARANPPAQPAAPPALQSLTAWVLVALLGVGLLWFNTGLFGFRPSLVSGYSMKPAFVLGDIVVSRTVPLETLQVGDVIRFQLNGVDVVHRIKTIQTGADGQLVFITRGDNNNTDDAPVTAAQVQGQVVLTLPWLGWPAVGLRLLVGAVLGGGNGP